MKKLQVFLVAIALGLSSYAGAMNETETLPDEKAVRMAFNEEIQGLLKNIRIEIDEDVTANLVVTFNEKNELVVLFVDIKDHNVGRAIKDCLHQKKIQNVLNDLDMKYQLPVRIRA